MDLIANILGYIIRFIYDITNENYALSIIIFSIFTKLILFPINLKQIKSSMEMQKIQPLYNDIMKKYKDDQMKQSEELTKLYAEHKINPLSGCLPLLIQIPLIFAMFTIVRQPLTYVKNIPVEEVSIYAEEMLNKKDLDKNQVKNYEIEIAKKYNLIDMKLFNVNLGDTPSNSFSKDINKKASKWSLIVPILTLLLSIYQVKQSQKSMELTQEQKEMQSSMNYMMPIMSGYIAYTTPLALGIYWMIGSIMQIIQQFVINKIIKKENCTKYKLLNKKEEK